MKAQRWINILVVLGLVLGHVRLEQSMAVNFVNGSDVGFGSPDGILNLTTRTYIAIVKITANNTSGGHGIYMSFNGSTVDTAFYINKTLAASNMVFWEEREGGTLGIWRTDATTFNLDTLYSVAVSYNNSSTDNNPILYVDGVSQSITEVATPSGAVVDESSNTLYFGGYDSGNDASNIIIYDIKIYNRILSVGEILDIYNSRGASNNDYGLVFHVPMNGASGIQTFDGATLGATNYIREQISGLRGTPSGSPVGVADTILTYVDDH